ncbi:MAG: DUF3649 domain-containing protein [Acidobacteria bacterium]|nr:DUF3649 domain-containing protein [Acidobacteriota bacterium]
MTVATMTRWHVASRVLAAVAGGYAVSNVAGVGLAQVLPLPRADAVLAGVLSTYLVYGAAVVWCFGARTARHAWLGLLITGAFFAALGVLGGSVRS